MASRDDAEKHFEEAAYWLTLLLSGEVTSSERQKFEIWLEEDERHASAMAELRRLWVDLSVPLETAHSLPSRPIAPELSHHYSNHLFRKAGMAICFLLAATVCITQWMNTWRHDHFTNVGGQDTWMLEGGGQIWLNTNTAIDIKPEGKGQRIKMVRGEAYFDNHQRGYSPLTIDVGDEIISALNSALNILKVDGDTVITVDRGQAIVKDSDGNAVVLDARTQYSSNTRGVLNEKLRLNGDAQLDWRSGKIVFKDENLRSVLNVVQRYESRWIIVGSAITEKIKLSTVIDVHNVDEWYRQLEISLGLKVKSIGPVIWIYQ